jgi:hypothetical protein
MPAKSRKIDTENNKHAGIILSLNPQMFIVDSFTHSLAPPAKIHGEYSRENMDSFTRFLRAGENPWRIFTRKCGFIYTLPPAKIHGEYSRENVHCENFIVKISL